MNYTKQQIITMRFMHNPLNKGVSMIIDDNNMLEMTTNGTGELIGTFNVDTINTCIKIGDLTVLEEPY